MRSKAPALLPIFRSRGQAELLATVLLHPKREYTTTELARKLDLPVTTLHRDVRHLIEAGIFSAREVGRSRLIRANPSHRAVAPLSDLLAVTFGPLQVVAEEFADLDGVTLVLIFGSWAARYSGEPGPPPNDIDVLVVGRPERQAVYQAAERAEERLDLPVNPTIRSLDRWQEAGDALVQQILSAATTTVIDHRDIREGVGSDTVGAG